MSHEIITVEEMRAIDEGSAAAGVPTRALMENAGRAVAEAIVQRFPQQPTAVLCGPGNNGGDGWVAARALREMGWPVWVETLAPRETLRGDAADAAQAFGGDVYVLGEDNPMADLFVDALFGAGLSKPLQGDVARLARFSAQFPQRIVAVDVPSGLLGDSGQPAGEDCFHAALTVTFVRKKPAHVLMPGREWCGEVVVANIGAPGSVVSAQNISLHENDPSLWGIPWPETDAHKHERGHVIVASGGHTRTGTQRRAR